MLAVSENYTAAVKLPYRTDRISGTIALADGTEIAVSDSNIVNNSVTLREQLVRGDTIEIGTFYTNELDITLYDGDFLTHNYANAEITLFYGVQLAGGAWEDIPLGVFTVDNSLTVRRGANHSLTGFDGSVKYDIDISYYAGGEMAVKEHIAALSADVGIEVETTDFSLFPNSDVVVSAAASSAIQTYRDMVEWCCALMGASAKINRYGRLEIVQLKEKVADGGGYLIDYTVEGKERTGTEFFDLRALIKYVSTTFDGEQYVKVRGSTLQDDFGRNATVFVAENPLIRSNPDKQTVFDNVADSLNAVLRRAEFTFHGNPAVECFDTIGVSGGKVDVGRTLVVFPTSLTWKYRGAHKVNCAFAELTSEGTYSVSAFSAGAGISPVPVKSKTDKRIDDVAAKSGGAAKYLQTAEGDYKVATTAGGFELLKPDGTKTNFGAATSANGSSYPDFSIGAPHSGGASVPYNGALFSATDGMVSLAAGGHIITLNNSDGLYINGKPSVSLAPEAVVKAQQGSIYIELGDLVLSVVNNYIYIKDGTGMELRLSNGELCAKTSGMTFNVSPIAMSATGQGGYSLRADSSGLSINGKRVLTQT